MLEWEMSLAASADIRLPACFQAITARHMHSLSHHLLHTYPPTLTLAGRHTHIQTYTYVLTHIPVEEAGAEEVWDYLCDE